MKIGIFDSGLGGLLITRSLVKKLPQYDYAYLGDTKRVPYGNRSQSTVYEFLCEAIGFLFKKDCKLVIVACNTASAEALRKVQREFLPNAYPGRRVLGIIIPTVEAAAERSFKEYRSAKNVAVSFVRVGVLATAGTVSSGAYIREFKKRAPGIRVFQEAAPLLVPLIENGGVRWAEPILKYHVKKLLAHNVDSIILGCTHYPILKRAIRRIAGKKVTVISQDEFISKKLGEYLERHPEIERMLSKNRARNFFVTDVTASLRKAANSWFGKSIELKLVKI